MSDQILYTIYNSYESLSSAVDHGLLTGLGNTIRLNELQRMCDRFRHDLEHVSTTI